MVTNLQDTVAAYRYILSDLKRDVESLATEHWLHRVEPMQESENGG